MAIPNYISTIQRLAEQFPQEWREAHTNGPNTEAFIRRAAWMLHQMDPRCGLNGKRGNPNDISDDVICYRGEGNQYDPTNGNSPVAVIDCIAGAGGPNPSAAWQVIQDPHAAAWVQPSPVGAPGPSPTPTPPPPAQPCKFQPVDLSELKTMLIGVINLLAEIRRDVDEAKGAARSADQAAAEAREQAKNTGNILAEKFAQGFVIDANARYIGKISGTVK